MFPKLYFSYWIGLGTLLLLTGRACPNGVIQEGRTFCSTQFAISSVKTKDLGIGENLLREMLEYKFAEMIQRQNIVGRWTLVIYLILMLGILIVMRPTVLGSYGPQISCPAVNLPSHRVLLFPASILEFASCESFVSVPDNWAGFRANTTLVFNLFPH
jgi:hypothetical protein